MSDSTGWITPPDPNISGDYWVTRRRADAAPGYGTDLPDIRERYHWDGGAWMPGYGAWITGYWYDAQGRKRPTRSCLHSNNGWRIEGAAP
jgi:hypothetical protein